MREGRFWILIAVIVLIIVSLACGDSTPSTPTAAPPEQAPAEETPAPTDAVQTITTVRGDMTVPGIGYMDGRDAQADPPLTVMNINIWDAAERTRVVCELEHGTQVDVLAAAWVEDEERHYFQITGDECGGWIQAPFISPEYHEPIGDEV